MDLYRIAMDVASTGIPIVGLKNIRFGKCSQPNHLAECAATRYNGVRWSSWVITIRDDLQGLSEPLLRGLIAHELAHMWTSEHGAEWKARASVCPDFALFERWRTEFFTQ